MFPDEGEDIGDLFLKQHSVTNLTATRPISAYSTTIFGDFKPTHYKAENDNPSISESIHLAAMG